MRRLLMRPAPPGCLGRHGVSRLLSLAAATCCLAWASIAAGSTLQGTRRGMRLRLRSSLILVRTGRGGWGGVQACNVLCCKVLCCRGLCCRGLCAEGLRTVLCCLMRAAGA